MSFPSPTAPTAGEGGRARIVHTRRDSARVDLRRTTRATRSATKLKVDTGRSRLAVHAEARSSSITLRRHWRDGCYGPRRRSQSDQLDTND